MAEGEENASADKGDFCRCTGFLVGVVGGGSRFLPTVFGGESVGTPGCWFRGLGGLLSPV